MIFGPPEDKRKFFDKYVNGIKKYEHNAIMFYKDEEKKLKQTATEMIRKIQKLFAMAKPDEPTNQPSPFSKIQESNDDIVNRDVYNKIAQQYFKWEKEIKIPKRLK
jgi:esterase/lipase